MSKNESPRQKTAEEIAEERDAALALAKENKILMKDPFTASVINNGGKTPEGKDVGDIGDFLEERRKWIEGNSDSLHAGPRRLSKDHQVVHSKAWEEKESHE